MFFGFSLHLIFFTQAVCHQLSESRLIAPHTTNLPNTESLSVTPVEHSIKGLQPHVAFFLPTTTITPSTLLHCLYLSSMFSIIIMPLHRQGRELYASHESRNAFLVKSNELFYYFCTIMFREWDSRFGALNFTQFLLFNNGHIAIFSSALHRSGHLL